MQFNSLNFVSNEIRTSIDAKKKLIEDPMLLEQISSLTDACIATFKSGGKLLIGGNGGSAADAQHIAGEFVSRFYFDRPGLPAIALSTDTSVLTAIGNDYGYENLFSRQVEAHGKPGDLFIGITTSGKSPNILKGFEAARSRGMKTAILSSSKGVAAAEMCDYRILVPSEITPKIQECHITIGHAICAAVESALFKK